MLFLLALAVVAAILVWAAIHESLRADKAEAHFDNLWKCHTCAAMFEPISYDDEVTQCTRCVEVEELSKRLASKDAEIDSLIKSVRNMDEQLGDKKSRLCRKLEHAETRILELEVKLTAEYQMGIALGSDCSPARLNEHD